MFLRGMEYIAIIFNNIKYLYCSLLLCVLKMTGVFARFFGFRCRWGEIFALLPYCTMFIGNLCLVFLTLGVGAGTFFPQHWQKIRKTKIPIK
jgi:hypothetical protein